MEVTKKRVAEAPDANTIQKKMKMSDELKAQALITEEQAGISQFINKNVDSGFQGLLKQRYSDFMVNEVDLNGNVIHLLDEGIDLGKSKKERNLEKRQQDRAELQSKTPEEVEEIKKQKREEAENQPKYVLSEENRAKLLELVTAEELTNIEELFTKGGHTETKTTFTDKTIRTSLHRLLREAFQGKLESVTSAENTFRIEIAKNSANSRRNHMESMNHVDENGVVNYGLGPYKNYLHFTVYKENRETMEVASTISKLLRIPSKTIRFSGTKDRRGVTCQKFAIHKGKAVRVSQMNKGLKNVVLGGFSYEDHNLDLGDLKGNEFIITIRDAKTVTEGANLEAVVQSGFDTLKNNGFINYYGMQRFGTFSIPTYVYGIHLLKDDWKGFVNLLLSPQEVVVPDSLEARQIWAETSDPEAALKKMPPRCTAEFSLLKSLKHEKKNDKNEYGTQAYFKSIMSIPRNLRIMYAHSYQSYIWNKVASKRIELFGLEVVEGDLIIAEKKPETVETDENGDVFEEDKVNDKFTRARPLTKDDISTGKYTIFDVVLPMPGFDVVYPSHKQLEQVYVDEMAKDGLDPFKMARRVREFSLSGSYRPLMGRAENLDYQIVKYTDPTEPLVRTDLELLQAKKNGENLERIVSGEGDKTAVVLRLQLGVSSYATMALREFMKVDTSRFSDSVAVLT